MIGGFPSRETLSSLVERNITAERLVDGAPYRID